MRRARRRPSESHVRRARPPRKRGRRLDRERAALDEIRLRSSRGRERHTRPPCRHTEERTAVRPARSSDPALRLRHLIAECGAVARRHRGGEPSAAEEAAGRACLVAVEEVDERERGRHSRSGPTRWPTSSSRPGSTGVPKGVFDNHRNVLHNILRYTNALRISPADRLTLLQGPAFSGCVSSQFGALLNGAASFPFRLSDEGLVRAAEWLRRERITIYHSVPSIFRAVVGQGGDLSRTCASCGSRATVPVVRGRRALAATLLDGLPPRERARNDRDGARASAPAQRVRAHDRRIAPGRVPGPRRGGSHRRQHRAPLPRGAIGEISVVSAYLALGYWKHPTHERAVPIRDGRRRVLHGRPGRLGADGCLEYLGRKEGDLKMLGAGSSPRRSSGSSFVSRCARGGGRRARESARRGQLIAYVVAARSPPVATRAGRVGRAPAGAMLPSASSSWTRSHSA